jgi:hypothetical protein
MMDQHNRTCRYCGSVLMPWNDRTCDKTFCRAKRGYEYVMSIDKVGKNNRKCAYEKCLGIGWDYACRLSDKVVVCILGG